MRLARDLFPDLQWTRSLLLSTLCVGVNDLNNAGHQNKEGLLQLLVPNVIQKIRDTQLNMTHNERRINWIQEGLIGLGGRIISSFFCWCQVM